MELSYIKIKLSSFDINETLNEVLSKLNIGLDNLVIALVDDGLLARGSFKTRIKTFNFTVKLSKVVIDNHHISLNLSIIKPKLASLLINHIPKKVLSKVEDIGIKFDGKTISGNLDDILANTPLKNVDIKDILIVDNLLEIEVSNIDLKKRG